MRLFGYIISRAFAAETEACRCSKICSPVVSTCPPTCTHLAGAHALTSQRVVTSRACKACVSLGFSTVYCQSTKDTGRQLVRRGAQLTIYGEKRMYSPTKDWSQPYMSDRINSIKSDRRSSSS